MRREVSISGQQKRARQALVTLFRWLVEVYVIAIVVVLVIKALT